MLVLCSQVDSVGSHRLDCSHEAVCSCSICGPGRPTCADSHANCVPRFVNARHVSSAAIVGRCLCSPTSPRVTFWLWFHLFQNSISGSILDGSAHAPVPSNPNDCFSNLAPDCKPRRCLPPEGAFWTLMRSNLDEADIERWIRPFLSFARL